jgi:hypothetical protein
MTIETMDKEAAEKLTHELQVAAKEIAAKHGIKVWRGVGGTYYPEDGEYKFRGTFRLEDADAVTFKAQAASWGLSEDDLGRQFTDREGRTFTITGLRTKNGREPDVTLDLNGESRLMHLEVVKDYLSGTDRTAEGLKAKPGDNGYLRVARPKYMDMAGVEVIAVHRETERLTVKLAGPSWDRKVKERFGDKEFDVDASLFRGQLENVNA